MDKIDSFSGDFAFLSNFFLSPFILQNKVWNTVEHAYQAAKTKSIADAELIRMAATPGQAKRMGRKITLREDWEQIKINVMERLLQYKFYGNFGLAGLLVETHPLELIEGNNWGDTFWGKVNGQGNNMLGILLMELREDLLTSFKSIATKF